MYNLLPNTLKPNYFSKSLKVILLQDYSEGKKAHKES